MNETRTVHDPFLGKDVEVSDRLVDRLRGKYAHGPTMENGEPEFGWREFKTPPIQHEAAAEIERLRAELKLAQAGEPVAWRYQGRAGWGDIWRCTTVPVSFETPDDWIVQPLYVALPRASRKDTTVKRVYFHTIYGAFAVTEDGKQWRLSSEEIKNAINAPRETARS
jgi:hypothetical protein